MKNIDIYSTEMFPYLEGEEIKKGQTLSITIRDLRTEELKSHKGNKVNKEVLYFQETRKGFVLNKTNAKRIAQMHGKMTGEWEGKQITLTTESVQAFGEVHNALRVVPGAIGPQTMDLDTLWGVLKKVERIENFYGTPDDIMACRPSSSILPNAEDIDGWRVLFEDARNYAIDRMVEEAETQVPMTEAMAVEAATTDVVEIFAEEDYTEEDELPGDIDETPELKNLYPEIFAGEEGDGEDAQDITSSADWETKLLDTIDKLSS